MRPNKLVLAGVLFAVGTALIATAALAAGGGAGKQGGTLRINVSGTDIQSIDPGIDYEVTGWAVELATCLKLVNYPDKPGRAGTVLVPEAATGLPRVSADGKTYTFTIRPGFAFNTGEKVTAQTFAHVINRDLAPALASPAVTFLGDVVGADAVTSGKLKAAPGVTARGNKLTVRLTRVAPDFVARIGMNFFCAVPVDLPNKPQETSMPSAGPYYVDSRTPNRLVVVKRNPNYHGTRPHNPDLITLTTNTEPNQSLLQIKAGQADYELGPLPPQAVSGLAKQYGVNKGRFFVHTGNIVFYAALNTRRLDLATRKAINYAIDRPALIRQAGAYAGTATDQILPPTLPGYRDAKLYPLNGPDIATAKKLMAGRNVKANLYTTNDPTGRTQGQVFKANLAPIGIDVNVKALPFAVLNRAVGDPKEPYDIVLNGWFADYPDPVDFINILLDGRNITSQNNVNVPLMNIAAYNERMERAERLSGTARYAAFGKLDVDIMRNVAPWVAEYNGTVREFVSPRVGCYVFRSRWGSWTSPPPA